jgi:hypothetical protein
MVRDGVVVVLPLYLLVLVLELMVVMVPPTFLCFLLIYDWRNMLFSFVLDPPTVTVQQSSYSVTTGNSVTLVCSVSSSLSITSVQWQRNVGGTITTINSNTNTNKFYLRFKINIFYIKRRIRLNTLFNQKCK